MTKKKGLVAALVATTMLAGGFSYAASESPSATPPAVAKLDKDAMQLSTDAAQGFRDVAATRLAIFDGRIADARKDVSGADASFAKARTDRSVFVKAEADFKAPRAAGKTAATGAGKAAHSSSADAAKPMAWLPVDGQIILNEDYRVSPQKTSAVADANKSLTKNDRKGAMEKLKLAGVDVDYVVAVVPLDQTLADVHKAADLMSNGKYYEASQMLRTVQNSARIDVVDVSATPHAQARAPAAKSGTH